VLRGYSDAWFSAAKRRKAGDGEVRFPRRRLSVRFCHGEVRLAGQISQFPVHPS
jgi:hypothetical protein